MTDNTGQAPPGWYADTTRPGTERWWDGLAWTEHTRSTAAAPPPPPPPPTASGQVPGSGSASPFEPRPDFLAGAPSAPPPSTSSGRSTGIVIGIVAAAVVFLGGCVALLATGANSVNDELADFASTIDELENDSDASADEAGLDELLTDSDGDDGDALDDVVACERIDSQTIVLEVVNGTSETSSYVFTVGFFDDAGTRLGDEPMFLNHLRPGERAVEEQFTFDEQGTVCEVLAVDRFAAGSTDEDMAQVSDCEIAEGPDVLGSLEASVSVTNDSSETSDFGIDVAFVDPDGIRRGSGSTYVQAVRPGETAPSDLFTILDHDDGYSCEVVAVTRLAS